MLKWIIRSCQAVRGLVATVIIQNLFFIFFLKKEGKKFALY